ncbi:MAG: hypothetical protein AAGF87_05110 [Bacteroidota bacterium]
MKHLFLSVVLALGVFSHLSAQQLSTSEVYKSKSELIAHYDLDDEQAVEIDRIIDQRENNLNTLDAFGIQGSEVYLSKRRAMFYGEMTSIRLILNKPAQIEIYDAELRAHRRAETERVRELVAAGHEPAKARVLMLERY